MGHFCGVEMVKRFVNIHLQPENGKQNVDVAPHGKISADAHVPGYGPAHNNH